MTPKSKIQSSKLKIQKLEEAHDYLSDNKHWWDAWELPFFEG